MRSVKTIKVGDTTIRIGLVQMAVPADRELAFEKIDRMVSQCADQGAKLVCLPELPFDPYFCQSEDHEQFKRAEDLDGEIVRFSSDLAKKYGLVLLTGLFERRAPGVFHNSFLVFESDGDLIGRYRKAHIPDDPNYYEKFFFTPGDDLFPVFETSVAKIGVCICWDQWFPEAARLTAMAGAEIIFFPTAIGWLEEDKENYGASQLDAWITMMRSHAIANGTFVCAVNRTGLESQIDFWGNSFVCDPYGNLVARADATGDRVIVSDVDLGLIESARTHWPFFRDRRTDLYADLSKKWR